MCCLCDPNVCLRNPSICQIYMRDVISEFNSEIEGSQAFCALMLFLCSGSSLHVECILPFGMLYLFAWRMMCVKMVFVVRMSGGG